MPIDKDHRVIQGHHCGASGGWEERSLKFLEEANTISLQVGIEHGETNVSSEGGTLSIRASRARVRIRSAPESGLNEITDEGIVGC